MKNDHANKVKDLAVIIAAGGSSERFKSPEKEKNKLLADLNGKPVFIHSIANFLEFCSEQNIIVSANPESIDLFEKILKKSNLSGIRLIQGGKTRMHSVFNALKAIPQSIKFAAVHDAARPMSSIKLLKDSFIFAKKHGSAIVAKKITDTVKKSNKNDFVCETIPRDNLWIVETPQIFKLKELIKAYEKAFKDKKFFTDDAGIMEYSGHKVKLFHNISKNIKITFYHDLCEIRKNMNN